MRKNPWIPLAALLLSCGAFYLLIVSLGWGAVRTAVDAAEDDLDKPYRDQQVNGYSGSVVHLVLPAHEAEEDTDPFRFPDDRAGQILSKTLPPSEKSPTGHDAPAPRRLPPPTHLDKPSLPLPPSQADMPRLPAGKTPSLRPRPLPEELPLISHKADPLVPEVQYLHAGDRVRLHSVDVNKPIPLPILAQPVGSRAPLDDATTDASLAAALAATPPARATPAPFLKLTLPDPFENRLKPPTVADENIAPAHTGSRPGH